MNTEDEKKGMRGKYKRELKPVLKDCRITKYVPEKRFEEVDIAINKLLAKMELPVRKYVKKNKNIL